MKRTILYLIFCLCSYLCLAQTVHNPIFERSCYENRHPHVDKVEIIKDTIIVYCSIFFDGSWGYNIPSGMFIEDVETNKRYRIIKCEGLPFEPEERLCGYGGKFQFVFYFPNIEGLRIFNMIENEQNDRFFNFYGVNISEGNNTSFDEYEYNRYKTMSDFYKSSNDKAKYFDFKIKELDAACYIFGTKSMAAALCYQQLSYLYYELGDYPKALQFGLQELECDSIHLGVINQDYPVYAIALGNIADIYSRMGEESKSIAYREKAIAIRKDLCDSKEYLFELENMVIGGDSIARQSIVEEKLDHLPEFVDTTSIAFISVLKALTIRYEIRNNYNKALFYCDRSLSILKRKESENTLMIAEVQGRICRYKRRLGFFSEALEIGEKAKNTFDSLKVKPDIYMNILEDLSWCYGMVFDYESAIHYQEQIAQLFEENQDWISLAEVYSQIGHYYMQAENDKEAEYYTKKSIEILNDYGDARKIVEEDSKKLGNSYIFNPQNVLILEKRINYDKANSYQGLARICQKEGKLAEAIIYEKESGKVIKEMGEDMLNSMHYLNLAEYYRYDKQYTNAIKSIEKSLDIVRNGEKPYFTAMHYFNLSFIYYEKNDVEKAIQYAEKAVNNSKELKVLDAQLVTQPFLSRLYWGNSDFAKAEKCMSEVLNNLQDTIRVSVLEMTSEQKQRMWDRYEPNFLFYRRIMEKLDKNHLLLSKFYDYTLFSKSLLLESEIRDDNLLKSRLFVKWQDIQRNLSKEDVAIEFITMPEDSVHDTYYALVIDNVCNSPSIFKLYKEADLNKIKEESNKPIIDVLGDLIWNPIIKKYKTIKNIYFSPEGILNILPIEHCKVEGIGEIMDYYNLFRLSSTKELIFKKASREIQKAALYGGLDYEGFTEKPFKNSNNNKYSLLRSINERGGFEPLFNTLDEVNDINNILKGKNIPSIVFTGMDGTEESFKGLSEKEVNIIHLSTHGMYVEPNDVSQKKKRDNFDFMEQIINEKDPVKEDIVLTHSFLVMSGGNKFLHSKSIGKKKYDGILTAFEISQMDLKNIDLVVLSACETGLGDLGSGGIYGLQRGFKKAGVKTILMSLDKVDDEATKILMVEFYRNMVSGKTKPQSLKTAQKYLRQYENGKYKDPKYWASFILLDGLN